MSEPGRAAVFLDRDGVLNALVTRDGRLVSPRTIDEFRILEGVPAALDALRAAGFLLCVVTNQPDLARGHLARATLDRMHASLRERCALDEISVCPHDDGDCRCRKPRSGMLLDLASQFGISLERSWMIGDSWRDIEAGKAAGVATIRIGVDHLPETGVRASDLAEATAIILQQPLQ